MSNRAAAVWVELGDNRLLWILENGTHGTGLDVDPFLGDDALTERFADDGSWEELP